MLSHPSGLLSEDYILALKGCCPVKFLHALQPPKLYFSGPWGAVRPPVGLCPIFLVLFISPQELRAITHDRHETLPHDWYLGEFYNLHLHLHLFVHMKQDIQ